MKYYAPGGYEVHTSLDVLTKIEARIAHIPNEHMNQVLQRLAALSGRTHDRISSIVYKEDVISIPSTATSV